MKTATLPIITKELKNLDEARLMEICKTLARFKKENKELLTYLLFESDYEEGYIASVKELIDAEFDAVNTRNYYYMKKNVAKILRNVKKYIRYSKKKETEVALLLHFCESLIRLKPSINRNNALKNIYLREHLSIATKIDKLHEDLQLDYQDMLEGLAGDGR